MLWLSFLAILWLIDWLIQEAAKDLVKAEVEAIGEEHGGEWRVEESVGERGGPALLLEDLPEEEEEGVKAEEGVGEGVGGACMEEPLPDEGAGEKQGRSLETMLREVSSADARVREDAGTVLDGEECEDAWTLKEEGVALTGEEE